MVSLGVAIKRPFQDIKTAIVGIILGMIPIVNLLTIPGFALRNAKRSLEGDDSLLGWGDWGDIIVKSIIAIVIGIIYALPVIILGLILLGSLIFTLLGTFYSMQSTTGYATLFPLATGAQLNSNAMAQIGAAIGSMLPAAILLAVIALFIVFILPMAIMHWLKNDDLGAAFRLGSVIKKSFTGPYIIAWIFSIVITVVLSIVVWILASVPYAGTLIGGGLSFYVSSVTEYTLFAQAYRELE